MGRLNNIFSLNTGKNRVPGLDIYRALAILIVVYQHSRMLIADHFPGMPGLSFIDGVDVFFVLSGFLIGTILLRTFLADNFSISSVTVFWKRRWLRTLPNYFLVLLLVFVIAQITGSAQNFNLRYLFFAQNLTSGPPDFFPESWSLSVEEWFYLLLPLFLFTIWKATGFKKEYIFLSVAVLFIIFSTFLRLHTINSYEAITGEIWDQYFRKTVLMRFDMLMFGILAAYFRYKFEGLWKKWKVLLFICGVILMVITVNYFFEEWYIYLYISLMGISLMLMLPLAESLKKIPEWINSPFRFISVISYSMYLLNYSILLLNVKKWFTLSDLSESITAFVLYWLMLFTLSFLLYRLFEKPMMDLRERKKKIIKQVPHG